VQHARDRTEALAIGERGGKSRDHAGVRLWVCLGAGIVSLLVVLILRSPSEPDRNARMNHRPRTEGRGDATSPAMVKHVPGDSPTESKEEGDRREPIPGTERWHYEKFLRQFAADPDGFDRVADERTKPDAPLQERVALLRAAWKVRGKESLRWFSDALGASAGTPEDEALRGFAVRFLTPHARALSEVRDFLWESVFLNETATARDRSAAAEAVLQAADADEISKLIASLPAISDAAVAEGALVGLGQNDHGEAASALAWLSSSHPEKRVRDRAAEVARQRLAGNVGREEDR